MYRGTETPRTFEVSLDDLSIEVLELRERTRYLLDQAEIETLGDIVNTSPSKRQTIFKFELECLQEFEEKLAAFLYTFNPVENCA